jgi:hypothetical protein
VPSQGGQLSDLSEQIGAVRCGCADEQSQHSVGSGGRRTRARLNGCLPERLATAWKQRGQSGTVHSSSAVLGSAVAARWPCLRPGSRHLTPDQPQPRRRSRRHPNRSPSMVERRRRPGHAADRRPRKSADVGLEAGSTSAAPPAARSLSDSSLGHRRVGRTVPNRDAQPRNRRSPRSFRVRTSDQTKPARRTSSSVV